MTRTFFKKSNLHLKDCLKSLTGFAALVFLTLLVSPKTYAGCGSNLFQWDSGGGNDNWNTTANWNPNGDPNGNDDQVEMISGTRDLQINQNRTVACFEVLSGIVTDRNNRTLTVTGDYFKNTTPNSMVLDSASFTVEMAGTVDQEFSMVDEVQRLHINTGSNTITFTHPFEIGNRLTFEAGWTGTLKINADLYYNTATAVTIPAGATVEIGSGVTVTTFANWTINGTLKILPGGKLRPGDNETITVGTAGSLILAGASGNPAIIGAQDSTDEFNLDINGILNAEYFQITRLEAAGIDVSSTGTIQKLDDGEFNFPFANGHFITLASGATMPTTINRVGFSNGEGVTTPKNINATNYSGATFTVNDWSGSVGGEANDTDPNNKVDWGTQASTRLTVIDQSDPPLNGMGQNATATISTFSFALNQADTATDITEILLTMSGTASASDIDHIEVYRDAAGSKNCIFNNGTDPQIGSDLTLSGNPPAATVTITAGDVSTSSDTDSYCVHVRAQTTASASDNKTIQFSIEATDDVTNSQGYSFSASAGPPVTSAPAVKINGDPVRKWEGSNSTSWDANNNWTGGEPTATRDCEVGVAQRAALVDKNPALCQNANFQTGGTIDFNNTSNEIRVSAGLTVGSGYTFSNAANGVITLNGTVLQNLSMGTEFPGTFQINNTGTAGNDIVSVSGDSIFGGDLTIQEGTLVIPDTFTVTVKGDLTCETGGGLTVEAGGRLEFADGSTLTIDSGCTFTLVGSSGKNAVVGSTGASNDYSVIVNGTIAAEFYTFDHLGTNGVTINSGATIDSTHHLQDGTFIHPVNNSTTLLSLARQVPTNTMDDMTFSLGTSSATGTINIDTTGAAAGTLTLNNYTGDLSGPDFDTDPTYLLSWLGATNTISVTQEATSPASLDAGSTYNMGRFGFEQDLAGASFADTDITSFKVTLTGTGSANDIDEVKLYYDDNCDGSGGTLIGNGSLSGNPASRTFSISSGAASVEGDVSTPPKRCLYVEYVISAAAIDGNTVGVKLSAAGDIVNSQGYAINTQTLPPIDLGTAGSIVGASVTIWQGGTSTDWFTASNWSAGVPTLSTNCEIDSASNNPVINGASGTAVCKSMTIGNGTLTMQNSTGAELELYGSFDNTGTFTQNDGTFTIRDDGITATNQAFKSSSTVSALTFNKTAGGEVFLNENSLTITNLTMPSGSDFDFKIPNGKTLTLPNGVTITAGTLNIESGGTVEIGDSQTVTVASGGKLKLVGSSGNLAKMTSTGASDDFEVVVNGEIEARHYNFDHLGTNGVSIESGATINTTNHLQDGQYTFPVPNNSTLLKLKRKVPTDTLANMKFDLAGSSATGTKNIDTTGASSGTLTISSFLGDLGGPSFDIDPTYNIVWNGAINTIDLTQEATSSGPVNAGTTVNMGRFGFTQTLAGASFDDADLTSLKLTLTGTGANSDVDTARIFYDSDCNGSGGTEIGSGSFIGSPGTITFSVTEGDATIEADAATPPKRCIYVEYDISSGAVNGNTVGVEIAADNHVSNNQGYEIADATPTPVTLGAAISINGATVTTWSGSVSTDWFNASNWDNGVPSSTVNCVIPNQSNDPAINGGSGTARCKAMTINSGAIVTLTNATSAALEVYSNFSSSGVLTVNDGDFTITDSGTATDNTITSSSAISSMTFNKTSGGKVLVNSSVMQIDSLTFPSSSNFEFNVPAGKTLILTNGTDVVDADFVIAPGGTVKLEDAQTFTVSSGGSLSMVGTSSNLAKMTSNGSTDDFNVVINGTISAQHYQFDHLGTTGVSIESGATIDASNHLQNGQFTHPVNNSSTLLFLKRQVPSNHMNGSHFDLDGSSATGTTNINTTGAASGTLTIDGYTGNLAGSAFDVDPTYNIDWTGALNTIDLTQEATGPSSMDAGNTYNMGRFGFEQTEASADFNDTDITSLTLTLVGTASAADIEQVRIYYDADCNSIAGTLIGSGTFSGSPLKKTFTLTAGDATIEADASTPPKRCIYVEYDIAGSASNNATAGVKIDSAGHVVTDEGYEIADGTPPPVTLGTAGSIIGATTTDWTGSTSTDWFLSSNWSNGVPDSSKTCNIADVANDPIVNGGSGTAICKNVNISNGIVTLVNATSAVLEVHGNYTNSGTLNQNDGTLRFEDGGSGSTQTFSSTTAVTALTFDKTSGGSVRVNSSVSISTLTFPGGSNFEFQVPSGTVLTLPNGFSLPAATFNIENGGQVEIGNGQTVTVNGGTFKVSGVNDSAEQNLTNKGIMTVSGSGEWGFTATSGSVDLTGFLIKFLDVNGLNIGGSTDLDALDGGQFTNLKADYVTPVKAIQINTSGSVPATANNIGWMWDGPNNSRASSSTPPPAGGNFFVVHAPDCSSATITFNQWFGDFVENADSDTETHIHDSDDGGATCQVSIAAGASPVTLSELTATPYNAAVSLDWETVTETNHAGFNVYRSSSPLTGFIQVNSELIRNYFNSSSFRGRYRYIDNDVVNGQTYYYKIEDIAFNGQTEMHGPVHATPDGSLGDPPPDLADTNSGESGDGAGSGNDPNQGPIENADLIDLGNGVHIIAQTENSIRLEIIPPDATWSPSTWDADYETVAIPGYASTTEAGDPELLSRNILIEVSADHSEVQVSQSQVAEASPENHKVAPAPMWTPDENGVLEASYELNNSAYSLASFAPEEFFKVEPSTKAISGKNYVQIQVSPLLYHAVNEQVLVLEKLVLDIGLGGQPAWSIQPPTGNQALAPAAVDGNLRIKYSKAGMYELNYDDIVAAGLEGPFNGVDVGDLRLYYHNQEVAMGVDSSSGQFASGDRIYFYGPYKVGFEESHDEVVLSTVDVLGSGDMPLRVSSIDGDPSGYPAEAVASTNRSARAEYDWWEVFDHQLGDMVDRFYWERLRQWRPAPGVPNPPGYPYNDTLTAQLDMTGLLSDAPEDVTLVVKVSGRSATAVNLTHHVGIFVNSVPFMVAEEAFAINGPHTLVFKLPHDYFFSGVNNVQVKVLADMVPPGDMDIVYVDSVEAHFRSGKQAVNNVARVFNTESDVALEFFGFSSGNIDVFDITDVYSLAKIDNIDITTNGTDHSASFASLWMDIGDDTVKGEQYIAIEESAYLQPDLLTLAFGSQVSLKSELQADMIIIGGRSLLAAAAPLITARESEGLNVVAAPLDQVYAEFSYGQVSSYALRDFITHALDQWQEPKPKYLLLLGDATYDPRDRYEMGKDVNTMPIPIERGSYIDFGNDNWFVATETSSMPRMAVGRIPTSDHQQISDYVQKLLDYENGSTAPNETGALNNVFVSDSSNFHEQFAQNNQRLAASLKSARDEFKVVEIDRTMMGSDENANAEIVNEFNEGPLTITYLGHGAEDRWASGAFFNSSHAENLNNQRLPIVTGLNCLNSYFYDPFVESLGEKLILNRNGGAIAFWGSTAMTVPPVQLAMAQEFSNEVAAKTKKPYEPTRIGDIALKAKTALGENASTKDTIRSWTLFGDPSMKLPASAFAPAPPSKPGSSDPQPGDNSDDRSGTELEETPGNGGCGNIKTPPAGGSGTWLFLLLMPFFLLVQLRLRESKSCLRH